MISEIGGTVGDIESQPFLEAIRQFRREVGPENVLYLHVTLVPFIEAAGELKTKPTQHSVNESFAGSASIPTSSSVARATSCRATSARRSRLADVDLGAVIASPDVPDVYLVPARLQAEGLDALVCEKLLRTAPADLGEWSDLIERIHSRHGEVEIALVGKYVKLHDAYLSVHEALKHAGVHHGCRVRVRWVDAEHMSYDEAAEVLEAADGVLVPGGFGSRGWEEDPRLPARERRIPYLGICLGMHVAVSEFARHVCGLEGATDGDGSRDAVSRHRPAPRAEGDRGSRRDDAPRRAGGGARAGDERAGDVRPGRRPRAPPAPLRGQQRDPSPARRGRPRRLRHVPVGAARGGGRAADHPWFVASQFHPEFKSRPTRPAPLFRAFVGAALERARERAAVAVRGPSPNRR